MPRQSEAIGSPARSGLESPMKTTTGPGLSVLGS